MKVTSTRGKQDLCYDYHTESCLFLIQIKNFAYIIYINLIIHETRCIFIF